MTSRDILEILIVFKLAQDCALYAMQSVTDALIKACH